MAKHQAPLALSKKAISLFLRVGCERQFRLYLHGDSERNDRKMPPRQGGRAGLGLVGERGYDWQYKVVLELLQIFGAEKVKAGIPVKNRHPSINLRQVLAAGVHPYDIIVEATYNANTPTFTSALGLRALTDEFGNALDLSDMHPDLIQVLPPLTQHLQEDPELEPDYTLEMLPDGETQPLQPGDVRLRLRVIDIKLTGEPGAHYFGEVVYYSMTLAAWLREEGLDSEFVVVATPAVWPGSYDASELARAEDAWRVRGYTPQSHERAIVMKEDLEVAPVDAFAPRLRQLLTIDLPRIIQTPWQRLDWHVDVRCKGCEFLGDPALRDRNKQPTQDPLHCWPDANDANHLSRVVGITKGAARVLEREDIKDTVALSQRQATDPAFDTHQGLRTKRVCFPHRASALHSGHASVVPNSGGDALMPRWPDLRIFLFLDYDLATAYTAAIGIRAFWYEPFLIDSTHKRESKSWGDQAGVQDIFLSDKDDLTRERGEFLKALRHLKEILEWVRRTDNRDLNSNPPRRRKESTYQIYLWDHGQYEHLKRLVSRHLAHILNDARLRNLAWLFAPPELLPNPEDGSRRSPFTFVADVISNTVGLPVPHHYPLLDVVKTYLPSRYRAFELRPPSVHPRFRETLSDLLPSERIHEWWRRLGNWQQTQQDIEKAVRSKTRALELVTERLTEDLREHLTNLSAPLLPQPTRRSPGVAPAGYLWHEFTQLNAACASLEAHASRAMPPDERVARFKSARLSQRLHGQARVAALARISRAAGRTIPDRPDIFIYDLSPDSRDVNVRPGDIGFALAPLNRQHLLDEHPNRVLVGSPIENRFVGYKRPAKSMEETGFTGVSVEALDRQHNLIALKAGLFCRIFDLEQHTDLDFSRDVMLDRVPLDTLSKKVDLTLRQIGNPPSAVADIQLLQALGIVSVQGGTALETPASQLLWNAPVVHRQAITRNHSTLRQVLENQGVRLNADQWAAWQDALSQCLTLVWGPPGTGKSRTLRAILLAAVLDAARQGSPLRLLVTANTYTAIDNVLLGVDGDLARLLPHKPYEIYRIQSASRPAPHGLAQQHPDIQSILLDRTRPSAAVTALKNKKLKKPDGIYIVGTTPQQLHNLAGAKKSSVTSRDTLRNWFDMILLDEASQMDVATSTLVFSKRATDGIVVLAGDDLQLPPIHQAEPPKDLERVVGSVYEYVRHYQGVKPVPLNVNYRANNTLLSFTRSAGYDDRLRSHSPNLRLNLLHLPTRQPTHWPSELPWTADWLTLLDPSHPAVCFIYDDVLSSQVSPFEADAIAALVWLFRHHLADQLENELDSSGHPISSSPNSYVAADFWGRKEGEGGGIGVVTPHRAQMSHVVSRLQGLFPHARYPDDTPERIRGAVDTVERFQGQQRDVIIASFGIGDPDLIQAEDEFLYSLRRFNVLTSRARAKLIIFASRSLVEHLSNDTHVLQESRLLKRFVQSYCQKSQTLTLAYLEDSGLVQNVTGEMRYR